VDPPGQKEKPTHDPGATWPQTTVTRGMGFRSHSVPELTRMGEIE
jgi:hypothetical protein